MAQKPIFTPPPPEGMTSRLAKVTRRRGRILTLLVSLAALASFGGVIYWAHEKDREAGGEGIVPLIRADEKPIKIRPDTPGGLVVPNQDKTVYERVSPGSVPQGPEKLLLPPPVPQIPPPTPPQPPAPAAIPSPSPAPTTGTPAQALPAPPVAAPAPTPATGEPPRSETLTPPAPGTPPAPPAVDQPPQSPSIANLIDTLSGHRIQIASVRTEEQAKATWARLQQSNGDVLGSLAMRAVRADLGERGTFYRVQAGPLDEAAAQAACAKLRGRSVDCIVVKP
ncbi:MAG: SPOR domain-containing protein [Reyranellaceae bacterium]